MKAVLDKINFVLLSRGHALFPRVFFLACFIIFFLPQDKAFSEEDAFFSYKRFFINERAVSVEKDQSLVERDIGTFIEKFNKGLYDFSAGDIPGAKKNLREARRLWPEYYATDFLLARLYEESGEFEIAARYYRSYLAKLDRLRSGAYRFTGPIMIRLNPGGIESYDAAYGYVKKRMEQRGVDIDKVVPAFDPPGPIIFLIIALPGVIVILFIYRKAAGFWRKQKRIMDTPEGFWTCRNCGAYNPLLRNECEQCGHKK